MARAIVGRGAGHTVSLARAHMGGAGRANSGFLCTALRGFSISPRRMLRGGGIRAASLRGGVPTTAQSSFTVYKAAP